MRRFHRIVLAAGVAATVVAARPAAAQIRIAGTAGLSSAYGHTYFSLGAHLGYEVALGLEPNIEAQWWTGQTPSVFKLAPGLTWYLPLPLIRPYLGGYYAHWFVGSGFSDQDALGLRGGIVLLSTGPASVAVGVAYEHTLSCSVNCDAWIPEASVGVTF
jgi:hypothetical protein